MNKESLEHLSSLMDGELSHETGLFVARRLGSDPELGATWERYHLIRECLRRPGEQRCLSRISLESEGRLPAAAPQRVSAGGRWLRPLSGAAIAASVALAAVLLVAGGREAASPGPSPAPFTSPNPLNTLPSAARSEPASFRRDGLNDYLLRHNRAAGQVQRQGFVTVVPFTVATPEAPSVEAATAEVESEAAPDAGVVADRESGTPR